MEELNVSWAHMEDNDLHYLTSKIMSSIKCLNISGFLKQLADFGKLINFLQAGFFYININLKK